MEILDISLVTKTLINLIEYSFKASNLWNPEGNCNSPQVSPQPPDKLIKDSVGIYLYHVKEENHYKNLPTRGKNILSVHDIPLELSLYYQLTTHSELQTDHGILIEQKMLGIAIKALHDYPVIDDKTEIVDLMGNHNKVFPEGLCKGNNRLKIMLDPISPHDAILFGKTSHTPLRLTAYFQVRIIAVN